MTRFLVTGGAGFVGSHLCEKLLEEGHTVYSIDNLSTGSMKNIVNLVEKYPQTFKHFTKDIEENEELLSELIDLSDVVFHLAAAVGVKIVVEEPTRTLITNSLCTELVLKHAAKKNKRVIITSTSEVYGKEGINSVLKEDGDLLVGSSDKSRWSYAISKLFDEHLALAYHKEKGLPVTIVRLFNTVGPKQTGEYGMVVPRFIKAALNNEQIQVYGDGKQSRCFCYVKDVIDALINLVKEEKSIGGIYNIGSSHEISINDLAQKIKEQLKSGSEVVLVPYEKAYKPGFEDMKKRVPDTSKIKDLIGWQATTDLSEIIKKTAEYLNSSKD